MNLLESLSSFLDTSFSDIQKSNPLEGKIKPAPIEEKADSSVMAPFSLKSRHYTGTCSFLFRKSPTWKEKDKVEDLLDNIFPEPYKPSNTSWDDQI